MIAAWCRSGKLGLPRRGALLNKMVTIIHVVGQDVLLRCLQRMCNGCCISASRMSLYQRLDRKNPKTSGKLRASDVSNKAAHCLRYSPSCGGTHLHAQSAVVHVTVFCSPTKQEVFGRERREGRWCIPGVPIECRSTFRSYTVTQGQSWEVDIALP